MEIYTMPRSINFVSTTCLEDGVHNGRTQFFKLVAVIFIWKLFYHTLEISGLITTHD